MAFLKNLSKSVGKAAEQAKFEADKLMRVNKLNSEVGDLTKQIDTATASIGSKVIELVEAGTIEIPGVGDIMAQVKTLTEQLEAKSAELEVARAAKFEEGMPKAQSAEEGPPLSLDAVPGTSSCPECSASVTQGAKFCPECGHKME